MKPAYDWKKTFSINLDDPTKWMDKYIREGAEKDAIEEEEEE